MSMKIEIESDQNGDNASASLYVDGRAVAGTKASTAAQALAELVRDPSLPLYVMEWLVPREEGAMADLYDLRDLRLQCRALEDDNAGLRGVINDTKREAESLRRMVDLLLDRVEGRRG